MELADLLIETLDVDSDEVWENEVLDGLSLREFVAVFDWLGVDGAVAVDQTQIEVDREEKWLYAAIDTDSKPYWKSRCSAARDRPAAASLHRLTEKHKVSETEFLVDSTGYLTALSYHELNG